MSSKRAVRRRQCEGKVRFASREEAWWRVRPTLRASIVGHSRHLAPYSCRFCGGWHLGHNPFRPKIPGLNARRGT